MEIIYEEVTGYIHLLPEEAKTFVRQASDENDFVRDGLSYSVYDYLDDACPDLSYVGYDGLGNVRFDADHTDHEYNVLELKKAIGYVLDGSWKKRFEEAYFV